MAVAITVTPATSMSEANVLSVTGLVDNDVVTFRRLDEGTPGLVNIPGSFVVVNDAVSYADYMYPLDRATTYYVYDSTGTVLLATSATVAAVPSGGTPWIRDVVFPALRYSSVRIVDVTGRVRAGRITPYYVVGQTMAVTAGDVRSGSTGQIHFLCQSHAERDEVIYAMSTGNPVSLRVPAECRVIIDEMIFAPVDISEARFSTGGACVLTVDFVEVDLSEVATFQPVTYGMQTQNAAAAGLLYGGLPPKVPAPSGLSLNFLGKTYADMYLSPTGIEP